MKGADNHLSEYLRRAANQPDGTTMPRAPRRCPGGHGNCETLIRNARYCPDHTEAWKGERTASSRITSTAAWKTLRRDVLIRDGYQCQARGPVCIGYATEVDHTHNAAAGGAELDPANARAICAPCHLIKTRTESARGRRARTGHGR
jgi:5-methylcytosine-specific restriction protein A